MANRSAVVEPSKQALRDYADELEAEAEYRVRLAREGQAPGVDLGAAAGGLGARRLRERAERLRKRAA